MQQGGSIRAAASACAERDAYAVRELGLDGALPSVWHLFLGGYRDRAEQLRQEQALILVAGAATDGAQVRPARHKPLVPGRSPSWGRVSILLGVGRGSIYALAAIIALVASLAIAGPASARPGYVTFQGERKSQFTINGTQGFRITVERIGRRVELVASNGNSAATYIVHSPPTPDADINARFPGVGLISMHFEPSGSTSRTPAICDGGPSIRQDGVFRGTIKIRGERGFTRADASSARGFYFREPKESCKGKSHEGQSSKSSYALTAFTKVPGGVLAFVASKSPPGSEFAGSTSYFAVEQKHRHGMRSSRFAAASSRSGGGFEMSGPANRPEAAAISPPAPFSGAASFSSRPDAKAEWLGDLAVELPGAGTVNLAGPRFGSELCFGRHCVGRPDR